MSLKAVVTFLNGAPALEDSVANFVTRSVEKSTKVMTRNVKVATPVKEGHLKRSIADRMTSPFSGEVYSGATEGGKEINYAVFIEYGTRYIAPRAMFRKGVAASEDQIMQIFADQARAVKVGVLKPEK